MNAIELMRVGSGYQYKWPSGHLEDYPAWIEYQVAEGGRNRVARIGFGLREAYGKNRPRVVVWVDGSPEVEFLGADDYANTGELLSEIKVHGDDGEVMLRYPETAIPARYRSFVAVGLQTRVAGMGVHNAWAVLVNVSDHATMIALAGHRRTERGK